MSSLIWVHIYCSQYRLPKNISRRDEQTKRQVLPIDVAPITQVMHVRNENSNIQGHLRSLNVIKAIFHSFEELLINENKFPLKEVPISKRIEENHCLIQ